MKPRSKAFTLVELLVVIGIILLLIAFLLPTVSRVRESMRRTEDITNLRSLAQACLLYANDNSGQFPYGRTNYKGPTAPTVDDYTCINGEMWLTLLKYGIPGGSTMTSVANSKSGSSRTAASCRSIDPYKENYPSVRNLSTWTPSNRTTQNFWYQSDTSNNALTNDIQLGWIYWGNRDNIVSGTTTLYNSVSNVNGATPTPTSQTLWTCLCYVDPAKAVATVAPHVGNAVQNYDPKGGKSADLSAPYSTATNRLLRSDIPTGLGVALTDGSASFVIFSAADATNLPTDPSSVKFIGLPVTNPLYTGTNYKVYYRNDIAK